MHGYLDHTGLFASLIRWALMQGFDVHSIDLPGHRLSGGTPAAINHFDEYSGILASVLQREQYTDYALMSLSTGYGDSQYATQ